MFFAQALLYRKIHFVHHGTLKEGKFKKFSFYISPFSKGGLKRDFYFFVHFFILILPLVTEALLCQLKFKTTLYCNDLIKSVFFKTNKIKVI